MLNLFKIVVWVLASVLFQYANAEDCSKALIKDKYYESKSRNLKSDYIKTINQDSWQQLKQDGSINVIFDEIPIGATYSDFEASRSKYLSREHYNRSENEASTIIRTVTTDRAYQAYEACLLTVENGPPLRVWVSRETMNEIHLRILYKPSGTGNIYLKGAVTGGSVEGMKPTQLWKSGILGRGLKVEANGQKLIVIKRTPGIRETSIKITPNDNSAPISLNSVRADATLAIQYDGNASFLRDAKLASASVSTPNNDHAYNLTCPNRVYQTDDICTSRTYVTYRAPASHFIGDARLVCDGQGCSWTNSGPVTLTENKTLASGYIDNWGPVANVHLVMSVYERVGQNGTSCGSVEEIPVIKNIPIVLTIKKDCSTFAKIKWTSLLDGSEGIVNFGSEDETLVRTATSVTSPDATVISMQYKLAK